MPETEVEIWEEPVRGGYFDPRIAALPADERDAAFHDGRWVPPPIHHLVGLTYVSTTSEESVFTLPVTGWLMPPHGVVGGATLFLLADGPLGSAIGHHLPPATPYTTSEISLFFLRPVTRIGDMLAGRARLVHVGGSVALSDIVIEDGRGQAVARGGCRVVRLPPFPLPEDAADQGRAMAPRERPTYSTPDPYLREPRGEIVKQEHWDTLSGLEVLRRCITGEFPRPPISHLTGLRPAEVDQGTSTWRMPASAWHCSPVPGRLYGGSTAFIAGTAVEGSIATTTRPGTAMATVDLKVYFLRPVTPDGRDLVARGKVLHRGRQVAVASSEVFDADGKLVAVAMGSAMILPGRPAAVARAVESDGGADMQED
jgi:uncharacterized protein (TIGR00369 family)